MCQKKQPNRPQRAGTTCEDMRTNVLADTERSEKTTSASQVAERTIINLLLKTSTVHETRHLYVRRLFLDACTWQELKVEQTL